MKRTTKICVSVVAFLPSTILVLSSLEWLPWSGLTTASALFCFPAFLLEKLADAIWGPTAAGIFLLIGLVLWPWLVVRFVENFAEEYLDGKFDWEGFWVRFFCGVIVGAIYGWRVWIGKGKRPDYDNEGLALIGFMVVFGILGGIFLGFWKEDFWKRPL